MDEVRNKLTQNERAILSDLWENKDLLRALTTALSHRQLWLANESALMATDFNRVMHNRGQITEDNWVISFLKDNFKKTKQAREATAAEK